MPSVQITALVANEADARHLGAVIEAAFEEDCYPTAVFENPEGLGWKVDLYAEGDEDLAATLAQAVAGHAATETITADVSGKVLPDTDWVLKGLEGLGAVRAGRFVVHGIHARDALKPTDISLQIEASRAFGTGHHGTTEGCLSMIGWLLDRFDPQIALDVGTGTGVLAVAIAKRAGIPVIGTDIDTTSVRIAKENASINGVSTKLRFIEAGDLKKPLVRENAPYDLVVANILAGPLMALAPSITSVVSERGAIILSGLLVRQERAVMAKYRALGFVPLRKKHISGWSTLLLGRG